MSSFREVKIRKRPCKGCGRELFYKNENKIYCNDDDYSDNCSRKRAKERAKVLRAQRKTKKPVSNKKKTKPKIKLVKFIPDYENEILVRVE